MATNTITKHGKLFVNGHRYIQHKIVDHLHINIPSQQLVCLECVCMYMLVYYDGL